MKEDMAEGVMENSIIEEDKVEETSPGGVIENSITDEGKVDETSAGGMEEVNVEDSSAGGVIEDSIVEEENVEDKSPRRVIENSIVEEEKVDEITPAGVMENSIIDEDKVEETSQDGVIEISIVEEENVEGTSPGGVVIENSTMEEEQVEETSHSNAEVEKVEETSPGGVTENPLVEEDKVGGITESSIVEEEKVESTSRGGVIEDSIVEETSPTEVIENSVMEEEKVDEITPTGVIENSEKVEKTSSPRGVTLNSLLEEEKVEEASQDGVTEISLAEWEKVEEASQDGVTEISLAEWEKVEGASPRGVIENSERSCESDSSSKSSDSDSQSNPRRSHWRGMILSVLKSRSIRRLGSLPPRRGVSKVASLPPLRGVPMVTVCDRRSFSENANEFTGFKPSWRNFTISELQLATRNFSSDLLIGKGGYAEVYRGRLQDGKLVAVKKLTRGTQEERTGDFLSEIGIIVHVNHPNTAKLIGYGVEGGLHLVLEFSPNGSLASVLHESNIVLDWGVRYKIAVGIAEGLLYLHETCQRRIIHRDIKSANILLTENFEPQITDFGLSKWLPDQWTHHTVTKFEGTFGYLAPEYSMHGIVDEKTDVYAFGVLLLELITGKRALEENAEQSLVMWAKPLLDKNEFRELVDPSLGDSYDRQQLNHLASAAALCIQQSSILRPRMSQVIPLLKGSGTGSDLRRSLHRTCSAESFDVEEYSNSRYLKDLNRHRQLALDF